MIYAIMLLVMYCLFLTLFIVKIQNQLNTILENKTPEPAIMEENIPISLPIDRITTLSEEGVKNEELKLDEAAKAFEAVINSKSREEIDQWINSDEIDIIPEVPIEQLKSLGEGRKPLHNLNKSYNKEY